MVGEMLPQLTAKNTSATATIDHRALTRLIASRDNSFIVITEHRHHRLRPGDVGRWRNARPPTEQNNSSHEQKHPGGVQTGMRRLTITQAGPMVQMDD